MMILITGWYNDVQYEYWIFDDSIWTHKIDTYRRYVAIPEAVISESEQNAAFSHPSVTNDDQLSNITEILER